MPIRSPLDTLITSPLKLTKHSPLSLSQELSAEPPYTIQQFFEFCSSYSKIIQVLRITYEEAWCIRNSKDLISLLLSTHFATRIFPSLELIVVAQLLDQETYLVETHHCEFMSPFSLNYFQFSKLRG
ncbi:hypothetical protein Hanom_Chr13g01209281 [Helianthus anomalus]